MINKTTGFSIIEMTISIMISAMLMTAALTIYNQISKGAVTVARVTQQDTQMMILHNRISKDLQGLIPLSFTAEDQKKPTSVKAKKNIEKEEEPSKKTELNDTAKKINFLYAQSQNDQFHLMSFVTTNALQLYGDKLIGTARIVYKLQPDPAHPKTFQLMRKQEETLSTDFDIEKLSSGKFDQIAHKIIHCSVEYGFVEHASDQKGKIPEKPLSFKFVFQWGFNAETQETNSHSANLPDVLKMTIKLESSENQEPKVYELLCTIPNSQTTALKSFTEEKKPVPVWKQNPKTKQQE